MFGSTEISFSLEMVIVAALNARGLGAPSAPCREEVPVEHRGDAVSSLVYEANARMRDPIYGCVGAITSLQRQVESLQTQLALAQAEMVRLRMAEACAAALRNGNGNGNGSSSGGGSPSSMSDCKPTPDLHVAVDQHNVMELEYATLWY